MRRIEFFEDHLPATVVPVVIAFALLLGACTKASDAVPPAASASTDQTAQTTTPAPAGDATPKAADDNTKAASGGTDQASRSPGAQSTVGSAAAGAPPYTLNSAPEGNKAAPTPKK